jgi:hypothetical protein
LDEAVHFRGCPSSVHFSKRNNIDL